MQAVEKVKRIGRTLIPKGSFKADLLTMMTGTSFAQLLTVVLSPVMTRLYTPAAFGILGVYLSLAAILNSVSTLRYDQALMLPKENETAANLFWCAALSTAMISGLTLSAGLIFLKPILSALREHSVSRLVLLLPVSILFYGIYTALNSWSIRQKQFGRSSFSQVARSFSINGVQIAAGIMKTGASGLIAGVITGDFAGALVLTQRLGKKHLGQLKRALNWKGIRQAAFQYRDFPLFSSSQNLLNTVSQNIPLLLLAKYFGPAVTGLYVLGVRGLQIPMNFISSSLRPVFFQRASETTNQGGDTYLLFKKTTLHLLALVAIPAVMILLFGPDLFAFILGAKWRTAGVYARWLILWLMLMFANVPAVLFAQIYRKQKAVLIQDICLLACRILAMVIGGLKNDPLLAIILYSLVGVCFNLFIILWAGRFLRLDQGREKWAS